MSPGISSGSRTRTDRGVAPFYARRIKETRNVAVRVHEEWIGGLAAVMILERLKSPWDPWVRLGPNVEVIVVFGGPAELEIVKGGSCMDGTTARGPQTWPKYIAAMRVIYQQIFAIRKGKPG